MICVIKPRGVLSQSDGSGKDDMLSIVKNDISARYNKRGNVFLGLVHRLDTNTAGTMVFAKTSKCASRLDETIRKRELINQIIQESLTDMGLTVKEEIDGDLTEGFVELIDTGSTGRGTNTAKALNIP